ncbi:MAG: hypothetical protein ACHQET_08245 [Chitinophagales bacterium]
MRQRIGRLICLSYSLVLSLACMGQSYLSDSAFYRQAVDHAVGLYVNSLGENSHLYNGSEYIFSSHGIKGFPFFFSDQPLIGSIVYDGTEYQNVRFSYDMVQDRIYITDRGMGFNIQLISEKISAFSVEGHQFMHIYPDSSSGLSFGPGFYDLLYQGKTAVVAKRKKQVDEGFKAEDSLKYNPYNFYFVRKNKLYEKVENKNNLIDLFPDQKDIIKKFYRKNKRLFKKNLEEATIRTCEYYDQLKK